MKSFRSVHEIQIHTHGRKNCSASCSVCFSPWRDDWCFLIPKSAAKALLSWHQGSTDISHHFSSFAGGSSLCKFLIIYILSYHLTKAAGTSEAEGTKRSITRVLPMWWSIRRSRKAFEIVEANPPYQHASKTGGMWEVGLPKNVPNAVRGLEGNLLVRRSSAQRMTFVGDNVQCIPMP